MRVPNRVLKWFDHLLHPRRALLEATVGHDPSSPPQNGTFSLDAAEPPKSEGKQGKKVGFQGKNLGPGIFIFPEDQRKK